MINVWATWCPTCRAEHEELRQLGEGKKRSFAERFVGRELAVLVQGEAGDGMMSGSSRNYLAVRFTGNPAGKGEEVKVRINGVNADGSCFGELVAHAQCPV